MDVVLFAGLSYALLGRVAHLFGVDRLFGFRYG
jgi:hypothetical protein